MPPRADQLSAEEPRELLDLGVSQCIDLTHIVDDLLAAARLQVGTLTVLAVPVSQPDSVGLKPLSFVELSHIGVTVPPVPATLPLKVGVQLPEVERRVGWAELERMAHLAEEVGLDSIWVGEHLLYRFEDGSVRGPWEAWSLLAALAATTTRVELGPLVTPTSFHQPGILAKRASTVDEISGGRLILGLGAGWNEDEYQAFGLPYDHRVSRFEEAFTIVRHLLQEGRVDFEGRFHTLRDCVLDPPGPRPGGPPLMVGSVGPRMLSITLPHVAAWNVWWDDYDNDPARFRHLVQRVDEACLAVGRDPSQVEATAALLLQFGRTPQRRVSSSAISGPPEWMAEAVVSLHRAGATHVQAVLDPITEATIEGLGEVVSLVDGEGARRR